MVALSGVAQLYVFLVVLVQFDTGVAKRHREQEDWQRRVEQENQVPLAIHRRAMALTVCCEQVQERKAQREARDAAVFKAKPILKGTPVVSPVLP